MATRRRRLRFRLTAAFALAGLVIPATLSVFAYFWARTYLVNQRESSGVHQTEANADLTATLLRQPHPDVARLLSSLQTPSSAEAAVEYGGSWLGTSADAGPDALPGALVRAVVVEGRAGHQRYHRRRTQELAVGIPLGDGNAYFEIFSLADLTSTLATLRLALIAGSLLGFGVGLGIGAWGTRRALRPLRDTGSAAAAIAGGRLDARLDAEGDQELATLATGFNAMVDSLQRRIERDARFASDVSHELRSPLTTLNNAVEVMGNRRDTMDPRSQRALDLLGDEVSRFRQLVEDLLEISRYDAGVARLDLEPVDVATLTQKLLDEAGQDAEVRCAPPAAGSDRGVILADRRRLEQALRNLIRNAVVHAGGATGATVQVGPEWTTVAVEDRGPGIPAGDRQNIFERFARGRAAGRRSSGGGVGLGLALVAEHVGLQGGTVGVEDADPHGSRFFIRLPTRLP